MSTLTLGITLNLAVTLTLGRSVRLVRGSGRRYIEMLGRSYVFTVLHSPWDAIGRCSVPRSLGFVFIGTLILGLTLTLAVSLTIARAVKCEWG